MNSFGHLLATFALALPAVSMPMPARAPLTGAMSVPGTERQAAMPPGAQSLPRTSGGQGVFPFADGLPPDTWDQVRIEQRLIIRITPRAPGRDEIAVAAPMQMRLRERKMANCLPLAAIAGVRPLSDTRLMLFLRDRRMVGADLGKSCNARDFYLGFYVSQTPDGQLCVGRDQIHSRSGTTCSLERVRELVPDN